MNRSKFLSDLKKVTPESFVSILNSIEREYASPLFVKVGANDGVTGDPCGDYFLKHKSWKGLLIEPVEYCANKLRAVYNDKSRFIIEQSAIGATQESRRFYYLAEGAKKVLNDLPFWYDQIGSFDRRHITKHFDFNIEHHICQVDVEVNPLSVILNRFGFLDASFLHIDTEGADLEVLSSLNFSETFPDAILVEYVHLSDSDFYVMIDLLKKYKYQIRHANNDLLALSEDNAVSL